jgi:hypothetical protein
MVNTLALQISSELSLSIPTLLFQASLAIQTTALKELRASK